jgi:fermentation-respiration switch protein FrsA (DUF1100 family)
MPELATTQNPARALRRIVKKALMSAVVLYALLLLGLGVFQRSLLYHPQQSDVTPEQVGLADTRNLFLSRDGARVQYWFKAPKAGAPMLVYFHGNAGHLGTRAAYLKAFAAHGFGFAIMSYRGYGQSEGAPTERNIYADAHALMEDLAQAHHVKPQRMIRFGESLGTGVAAEMATRFEVGALALQSPYTSVAARASELYPYVPVNWLLRDRYETLSKLPRIAEPLLILHGLRDEVIPVAHGQALYAAAGEPKALRILPDIHHSDFNADWVARQVKAFSAGTLHKTAPK